MYFVCEVCARCVVCVVRVVLFVVCVVCARCVVCVTSSPAQESTCRVMRYLHVYTCTCTMIVRLLIKEELCSRCFTTIAICFVAGGLLDL